jgi:cytochrome d ubiquinol oxidase subunit II
LPSTLDSRLDRAAPFIALSAATGIATLILLWHNAFRAARGTAALAVAAILWGWAAAQYPALIIGHLTVTSAAGPAATVRATFGVLVAGLVLLGPAVVVLFRVFGRSEEPATR